MIAHVGGPNVIDIYVSGEFVSAGRPLVPPALGDFDTETAFFLHDAWESVGLKGGSATTIAVVLPEAPTQHMARVPTVESSTITRIDIGLFVCGLLIVGWVALREQRFTRAVS
jgi:hypothetical protein